MSFYMPSLVTSVDLTRTHSVKPAQGLRYGNFEGVRNLPPIRKSQRVSEQNFWSMNNDQIYRTVCQWMETWQPWQQRTLLCGIANRCSVHQLEILKTTLEPLHHRDYKTVSRKRYPSAPFRPKVTPAAKKQNSKISSSKSKEVSICKTDSSFSRQKTDHGSTEFTNEKSKEFTGQPNESKNQISHTHVAEGDDKIQDENPTGTSKSQPEIMINDEPSQFPTVVDVPNSLNLYASMLSIAIVGKAVDEAAALSVIDKSQFSNSRENSNISPSDLVESQKQENGSQAREEPGENVGNTESLNVDAPVASKKKITLKDADEKTDEEPGQGKNVNPDHLIELLGNVDGSFLRSCTGDFSDKKSVGSGKKSRPMTRSSRMSSARFLGGTLEFATDSYRKNMARERSSASSRFRHSAFASSVASTTDYFNRKRVAVLGPMKRPMKSGPLQKPEGVNSLPVSLQKWYKHSRWWPQEPPSGKVYHQARKQELAMNFKEQLLMIWEWLSEWEDFERISFTKEVAKMCMPEVLDALLSHIQQRLRDVRDINRLPDKLLLYIFSFLEPRDIWNCGKVCRRWRYLCATDDLWILKCLETGEEEGISNMAALVEQGKSQGIDWMVAYTQLRTVVQVLKKEQEDNSRDKVDGVLPAINEEEKVKVERIWAGIIQPTADTYVEDPVEKLQAERKPKKGTVRIVLNTGVKERLEQRLLSKRAKEGRRPGSSPSLGDLSDTDSAFSEEDLTPMLQEYNMMLKQDSLGLPQKSPSLHSEHFDDSAPTRGKGTPRKSKTLRKNAEDKLQEETTPGAGSALRNASSQGSKRSKTDKDKEDKEKDMPLDIRTDLCQSEDLLGKLISKASLEWETPETYADYMRTTLYAGEVKAVKQMRKLQGHSGSILCLYFDKRRLATCGIDRVIRLWDVRSGRSLRKFLGHKGGIRCVQFDNDIMATGSWDCQILIWDMRRFENIATLQGHEDSVSCLEFNGDFMVSGSGDCTVRLWRRPTFNCQLTLHFAAAVNSLVLVGHSLIVATADLCLQMMDLYSGKSIKTFDPPLGPVHCLATHGQLLLGGDTSGRVCFWNLETGEMEAAVKVHDKIVTKIVYINGGRFFTASGDGTIKEWDLRTMTCLRVLKGHKGAVKDLMVSERRIVSCGDDSTTRIWDFVIPEGHQPIPDTDKQDDRLEMTPIPPLTLRTSRQSRRSTAKLKA